MRKEDLVRAQKMLIFKKAKWSQSISIPLNVRSPDRTI